MVCCLVQSYCGLVYPVFKKWPNVLIFRRSAVDFLFALHLVVLQSLMLSNHTFLIDSVCQKMAPVFQFSLFASVAYFLVESLDYYFTVANPFRPPATRKQAYELLVWVPTIGLTIFMSVNSLIEERLGEKRSMYHHMLQMCWTHVSVQHQRPRMVAVLLLVGPISVCVMVSLYVHVVCYLLLQDGGTQRTLETRKAAIQASKLTTSSFIAYWGCIAVVYAMLYQPPFALGRLQHPDVRWYAARVLAILLSLNGALNFAVWSYNNQAILRGACDKKVATQSEKMLQDLRGDGDANTRTDMSAALVDELLENIEKGMQRAHASPRRFGQPQPIATLIHDDEKAITHVLKSGVHKRWCPKLWRFKGVEQARDVTFKSYRPNAFQYVRHCLYGCDGATYLESFRNIKSEDFSGGKSGAFFFCTPDKKLVAKTITKKELRCLLNILDRYCYHMTPRRFRKQPITARLLGCSSLVTKIYGCYTIKMYNRKISLMVMHKLASSATIDEQYDLKGSWVGRFAYTGGTLKDNNLSTSVHITKLEALDVLMQAACDVGFLQACQLMDYSLLLSVHNCRDARNTGRHCTFEQQGQTSHFEPQGQSQGLGTSHNTHNNGDGNGDGNELIDPEFAAGVHNTLEGGIQSAYLQGPGIYYLGIIDVLTRWDCSKRMENCCKSNMLCHSKQGISSVEPRFYAQRFLYRVILRHFNLRLIDILQVSALELEAVGLQGLRVGKERMAGATTEYLLQLWAQPPSADQSPSFFSQKLFVKERPSGVVVCEVWESEEQICANSGKHLIQEFRQSCRRLRTEALLSSDSPQSRYGSIQA